MRNTFEQLSRTYHAGKNDLANYLRDHPDQTIDQAVAVIDAREADAAARIDSSLRVYNA